MSGKLSRISRVAGATALAATLVVGPLGLSSAQADLDQFSSTATGFALRVTVDLSVLPQEAKDAINTAWAAVPADAKQEAGLPVDTFPFVIDQYFARTTADASNTVTKAVSVLGDGFADLGSVEANNVGESNSQNEDSVKLPPPADQLDVSVLDAVTGVLTAAVHAGPVVDGEATVARVEASLDSVTSLLPQELQDAFQMLVDDVNATIAGTQGELNTVVQQTANDAETALVGSPLGDTLADAGLVGGDGVIGDTADLATSIVIPEIPNPLAAGTNLAFVTDVSSTTKAQRTPDAKAASDAVSQIKSANVLEDFLTVGLINLASHSEANGTPGSAQNSASCSLADVRLGDTAGVSLDGTNLYVEVNGEPVAVPVPTGEVAALKNELDGLLAEVGLSVSLCDAAEAQAAEDGTSASQSVSAFRIVFAPPAPVDIAALGITAGDPLVSVTIDPTVQTAVAATQAQAQVEPPASLPRTGAGAVVTILSGIGLAGGAIALRRRMR